ATCPAFCYRITVVNTSPDVPLVDLTVRDPDLGLSGCTFPTSLAPGATASCVIPNVRRCSSVVNTVTASAKSGFDATTVSGQDTATVTVFPISVKCDVVLHSSLDMDAQAEAGKPDDNHVTLPDSGPVNFSLTVSNTGQADLSVVLSGLPCSVDLDDNPIPTTFTLPVGASSNFVCTVEVTCPQGANITVTATGTAIASDSVRCVSDVNCNAIKSEPSICSAYVNCAQVDTFLFKGVSTLNERTYD